MRYRKGDIVFLIENNSKIRGATVIASSGGLYTIRFNENKPSAIRVKEHRLYQSEEEASKHLNKREQRQIRCVPLH